MDTLYEVAKNPSGFDSYDNYLGETPSKDWLVLLYHNRDSDILTESNWDYALALLGGESESVEIFRFGHWACGWFEYLCVSAKNPCQNTTFIPKHIRIANKIESDLADYPVLDEEDFYRREQTEAEEIWGNCYDTKERIEYIRENRDQFDFSDYSDMMGCIRGKYFVGYAGELIN